MSDDAKRVLFTFGDRYVLNGDSPDNDELGLIMFGEHWVSVRDRLREAAPAGYATVVAINPDAGRLTLSEDGK